MVAILVLFLIRPEDGPFPPGPGQGFSDGDAAALFGVYSALVLGAPLLGGWIGDRLIGPRRALVIGGLLIAAGHFVLLIPGLPIFWAGLRVIAAGTGLRKPNISTVLGLLYTEGDPRRDSGFSLFYLGINVGALAAIAGLFAAAITLAGFTTGTISASVTVVIVIVAIAATASLLRRTPRGSLEHRHMMAFLLLFLASVIYFAVSSQARSTITEFTQDWVQRDIGSFTVPTSWLLSLNPVLVVIFAPLFAALWTRLANRAQTTPTKVALSIIGIGLGFLIIAIPGFAAQQGNTPSVAWILATFLVLTWAELLIVPIALSTTTELAPVGLTGQLLGLWYLAAAAGGAIGGQFARLVESLGFGGYFLTAGLIVVVLGIGFLGLRLRWSTLLAPIR